MSEEKSGRGKKEWRATTVILALSMPKEQSGKPDAVLTEKHGVRVCVANGG